MCIRDRVMLLPLVLALAARRFYPRAIAWPRKLKDVTFGIWVVKMCIRDSCEGGGPARGGHSAG